MYSSKNVKDSSWEFRGGSLNSASSYQTSWKSLILYSGSTYIFRGQKNPVYQDIILLRVLETKPVKSLINVRSGKFRLLNVGGKMHWYQAIN